MTGQACPCCGVALHPSARYPVRLCRACIARARSADGRPLRFANLSVGGGNLDQHGSSLLVQGVGRPADIEEIKQIVIKARQGVPIRVADVADVVIGHEIRRGAVTADGKGEVVLGLGFMLMGKNTHEVTWAMKEKLAEVRANLPANVRVTPERIWCA